MKRRIQAVADRKKKRPMRNWRVATPVGEGSVLSVIYETHRGAGADDYYRTSYLVNIRMLERRDKRMHKIDKNDLVLSGIPHRPLTQNRGILANPIAFLLGSVCFNR